MVNHMRHTRGHTRNRRSHHALKAQGFMLCESCGMPRKKHTMCANCGSFKGKTVIDLKAKLDKKVAKREKVKANK